MSTQARTIFPTGLSYSRNTKAPLDNNQVFDLYSGTSTTNIIGNNLSGETANMRYLSAVAYVNDPNSNAYQGQLLTVTGDTEANNGVYEVIQAAGENRATTGKLKKIDALSNEIPLTATSATSTKIAYTADGLRLSGETGHYDPQGIVSGGTPQSTGDTSANHASIVKSVSVDLRGHVTGMTSVSTDLSLITAGTVTYTGSSASSTTLTLSGASAYTVGSPHYVVAGDTGKATNDYNVINRFTADSLGHITAHDIMSVAISDSTDDTGNTVTAIAQTLSGITVHKTNRPDVTFKTVKVETTDLVAASTADTLTITAAQVDNTTGIVLSGDANNDSFTIAHANTSSQDSTTAGTGDFIKSVTLDTYGHVTGLSTGASTSVTTENGTTGSTTAAAAISSITTGGTYGHELTLGYTTRVAHSDDTKKLDHNVTFTLTGAVTGSVTADLSGSACSITTTDTLGSIYHPYGGGDIAFEASTLTVTQGAYETSDETLKDFGEKIPIDFEKLCALKKNYFNFLGSDETHIGVSAQEIQKIYPEIVHEANDGYLSVDYAKLSVVALAAIDKLYEENQRMKEDINLIKEKLGL